MKKTKQNYLHPKVQLCIIINMENDKCNDLKVHILESVRNERALKIYFHKLHNYFTLLTLKLVTLKHTSNLII